MASYLWQHRKIFEPKPNIEFLLAMGHRFDKKYAAGPTMCDWQEFIVKMNYSKKDPTMWRVRLPFDPTREVLLESSLYGLNGLMEHKIFATAPFVISTVVDYHKLLEELCEVADIYIARYMNNDTHTGSDYHILRIYEAWCFKKRTSFAKLFNGNYGMKTGYVIDNDNVKARFIKEMLEEAERIPDRNKHALSIINLRRHAQPALDHLAAFQGYSTVTKSKDIESVKVIRKMQQNGNRKDIKTINADLGGKHRASNKTLDAEEQTTFFHVINNFQGQIRRQVNHNLIMLSESKAIFALMYATGMRAHHAANTFINSVHLKKVEPKDGATPITAIGITVPLAKMSNDHNVFFIVDHKKPERCPVLALGFHYIVLCLTKDVVPGIWNMIDCLLEALTSMEAFQKDAGATAKLAPLKYWCYRLFTNPYTANRGFNESTIREYLDAFLKSAGLEMTAKMHLARDTVALMIFEQYEAMRDHIHVRAFFHQNHDTMSHVYAQGAVMLESLLLGGWKNNAEFLLLDCAEAAQLPKLDGEFNAQLQSVPEELLDNLVELIFPNIKNVIKRAEEVKNYAVKKQREYSLYHVLITMNHCIRRALQRLTTIGGPNCSWNIPAVAFLNTIQFFDRPEWLAFNREMLKVTRNNTEVMGASLLHSAASRDKTRPEFVRQSRELSKQANDVLQGLLVSLEEASRVQANIKAGLHSAPVNKVLPVVKLPLVVGAETASTFYEDWCAKDPNDPELPSMSEYATARERIKWQEDFGMTASGAKAYKRNFCMLRTSALYLDSVATVKGYTVEDLCGRIKKLAKALNQSPSTFLKDFFYKLVSRPNTDLIDPMMVRAFEEAGIPFPPGVAKKLGKRGLGE